MPSNESQEENVYDVEKIVGDRIFRCKKQYLIKWVGYPDTENTWEFEDNLLCDELLTEYNENKNKKAAASSPKKENKKEVKSPKKKSSEPTVPAKEIAKTIELPITNEWHSQIEKVIGAFVNKAGGVEIEFVLKDGSNCTASSLEMRYKAPIKLLEFYEQNLAFPE